MRTTRMRYVSRERIEREIELQRIKRERLNPPPKKNPRKKNRKRAYNKRGSYKPKKAKTPIKNKGEGEKKPPPNAEYLIKVIKELGPTTRRALANITKLPRTTLFDTLDKLMKEDILKSTPILNGCRGGPPVVWSIKNPQEEGK